MSGLFHLEGEGESGGDREVRAEHARVAEDAELGDAAVQRRVAALREPGRLREHLRHHRPRVDALHEERAEVAVQRADEILLAQPIAGADDDRLLADAGVDAAADLALLDEDAEALVERANQLQPVEHLEQLFQGELELGAFDRRHAIEECNADEAERELVTNYGEVSRWQLTRIAD